MIGRLLSIVGALLLLAGAASFPVKITSDKFVADDSRHIATFTGEVVIVRNDLTMWADNVVVLYGPDGPSSISKLTATGNVRIKSRGETATGDQAIYDPKMQLMHLTGHVLVTNGKSTIGSPDLVIDLKSNVSNFSSSGGGGRVSGVFNAP